MRRRLINALRGAALLSVMLSSAQVAAQLSAEEKVGKHKAEEVCALCHGIDGVSKHPNAPNLAGQPAIYVAEQLRSLKSGKRVSETMSLIAKTLSDEEIKAVAAWYSSIAVTVKMKE